MKLLIINGPNLNLLGTREPHIYGSETLPGLERMWKRRGERVGIEIETFQSNHEGAIIDAIHAGRGSVDGLIINAGAFSHTSYAIHDAIVGTAIPTVEVHISNIHEREKWRHHSVLTAASQHVIVGRGTVGYLNAIDYLRIRLASPAERHRYAEHPDGFFDLRLPDGDPPHPVVALVHGGFWRSVWSFDIMDQLAAALTERGFATFNLEYRRGDGSFPAGNQDINAAIDWILAHGTDLGLDTDDVTLVGHSAGGYHVLHGAHQRGDVSGVVALGAVTDLRAITTSHGDEPEGDPATRFIGVDQETDPTVWDTASITGVPLVPVHLVHGSEDEDVPVTHARAYVASSGGNRSLTELPGVGHMELIDPADDVFASLVAAIDDVRATTT